MPKPSLKVKLVSRRSSKEEEENLLIAKSSGGAGLTIGSVVPGGCWDLVIHGLDDLSYEGRTIS